MVTGALAYDLMKLADPVALTRMVDLLRKHPQFDRQFRSKLEKVESGERDRALVMWAARWPDDIRGDAEYDQPKWHYIDFPFKPAEQPAEVGTAAPDSVNAVIGLRTNLATIERAEPTDGEKAVAICWVLHLIGDLHQPLHSVSLFTSEFPAPDGDQGGTKFKIRGSAGSKPISLHWFWDGLITGSEDERETGNRAIELRRVFPRDEFKELANTVTPAEIDNWVQESFEMAKRNVYQEGKLAGSAVEKDAPVLPEGYAKEVQRLAERRAALAGYRIALVLVKSMREQNR